MSHKETRRTSRLAALAALLLGMAVAIGACGSDNGNGTSQSQTPAAAPPAIHILPATSKYLVVSDHNNNRVLVYKPPFATDMNANLVFGQKDFTSSSCNGGARGLCNPYGVAVDPSGNYWVADAGNQRVVEYPASSSTDAAAKVVLGEPTNSCASTASSLCGAEGVASDKAGDIWVADTYTCRVLEFKPPFSNGMDASLVLGKKTLTNNCGTPGDFNDGQSGLQYPTFLTFDKSGNLWVSDPNNNRVLEFAPPFTNGMDATAVLGEPDFSTVTGCNTITATGLCGPYGIAFDPSGNLWAADTFCRVLEFTPPFTNGKAASLVLGQSDFTSATCAVDQPGLWNPIGVGVDAAGNVYVANKTINGVKQFSPPFSNDKNASLVIGQPNFITDTANTTQNGMDGPWGVSIGNTP